MKKDLGQDPRVHFKQKRIRAENEQERKIYTQLSDGSVPSFEDFAAVRADLESKRLTPLNKVEREQETMKEYLRLQDLSVGQSEIKTLQGQLNQDLLP